MPTSSANPPSLHVLARNVVSPQDRWTLERVLRRGGPGEDALAVGLWDHSPALVQRWNGDNHNIMGFPLSNGYPTWFVIPNWQVPCVLRHAPISEDDRAFAWSFLKLQPAQPNASGQGQ